MELKQAESEIAVIKKIMEDSKRIAVNDGKDFIIWGTLVFTGLIGTYLFILWNIEVYIGWLWCAVILIGWIFSIKMHSRAKKSCNARTFAGKILGALWVSSGIGMSLIGFIAGAGSTISMWAICPLISIILGIAYYVSGIIYGYSWINYISLGWWAGAVVMFIFPGIYTLLLFALMMAMLQILPGMIFYLRWKRQYGNALT
ncbi:MAG: hypothetical protein ABSF32_04135 [Ignavibacteria bacterium]|jgi:hypothetical protein